MVVFAKRFFEIPRFRAFCSLLLPRPLANLFGYGTFFDPKAFKYLTDLLRQIVTNRRNSRGKSLGSASGRPDLVQLLLDASVDEKEMESVERDGDLQKLTASFDQHDGL